MSKKDFKVDTAALETTFGQLDAAAAPAPEKKKDYKRISARLSGDNYIRLKAGTGALGCNMSELLDYAFGIFVEDHPEAFGTDEAAKDIIRRKIWDL